MTFGANRRAVRRAVGLICLGWCLALQPSFAGTAYWLWAGIPAPEGVALADAVYLHQGHFAEPGNDRALFEPLGMAPHPAPFSRVYLTYRLASLVEPRQVRDVFLSRSSAWSRHGVHVIGLQVDFDAASLRLGRYATFLRQLRANLPRQYALSVTGLGDWATTASAVDLKALRDTVDEIAFQMYRGRMPVQDWTMYARSASTSQTPFRIGLLSGMEIPPDIAQVLARNPAYRGPSYFILKYRK